METIHLQNILPNVFKNRDSIHSDVWHQDLTFEKGKSYLIEAASGMGKSSLCSFICGYRSDYEGVICFNEENIRKTDYKGWTRIRRKELSILFQELRLFPELTAFENVSIKNRLTGEKGKKEIERLFNEMGIGDKLKQTTATLSYGQQQRVAFIRALCQPFDFIFLDEPISHLDTINGNVMGRTLMEEARKRGAGIIVTSIGKHPMIDYDHILKL